MTPGTANTAPPPKTTYRACCDLCSIPADDSVPCVTLTVTISWGEGVSSSYQLYGAAKLGLLFYHRKMAHERVCCLLQLEGRHRVSRMEGVFGCPQGRPVTRGPPFPAFIPGATWCWCFPQPDCLVVFLVSEAQIYFQESPCCSDEPEHFRCLRA